MDKTELAKLHKEKAMTGFLYSIMGVTLPFILSLIGIVLIRKYDNIISFIDDGQILLFSAGLLTSAFYIFRDDQNLNSLKKQSFKFVRIVNHLTVFFLIITSVMYAILYSIGISNTNIDLNVAFVRVSSILLFLFSAYAAYSSIFIDLLKVYPSVDVKNESTKDVKDIMDQLGKGNNG